MNDVIITDCSIAENTLLDLNSSPRSNASRPTQGSPSSVASSTSTHRGRGGRTFNALPVVSDSVTSDGENQAVIVGNEPVSGTRNEAEPPLSSDWEQGFDEATGCHYWYNHKTEESSWVQPPGWVAAVDANLSLEERIAMALGEAPKPSLQEQQEQRT